MSLPPIIIRIRHKDGATDWNIERPDLITFSDTLEALNQVCSDLAVPAFEYEDEDGDRITVRSEEEMHTMLQQYFGLLSENEGEPLAIFPRVGKSAVKRNVEGLKVQTGSKKTVAAKPQPAAATQSETDTGSEAPMEQDLGSGSSRKKSGDIEQILACGNIRDADLQYLEVLGSGNCGTVYKALHGASNTVLAVKTIPVDCTVEARKQIIAELEILYKCNSLEIISFYGAYFIESRISMCTEFMDGGSLDRYGQIPEPILGRMSVSVVKGLQYLWSLKIMHRDVKPSNILVNTKGEIKLCDFGVSVQLEDTIAKTFVGTNAYMAPEKICGQDYRIQSEVWSLGISLFELAVGKFPYESANKTSSKPLDLLNSIVGKVPPQLSREEFSADFVNFVASCMQKDPSARPAPQGLLRHRFIERYRDQPIYEVANWLKMKLEQINLKKLSPENNSCT